MFFTRRSLYTEQLLHEASITEQFLHTDACSNSGYYIVDTKALSNKRLLHTAIFFTQRGLYTEQFLDTKAFTHRGFRSEKLDRKRIKHRSFYTQKLSLTGAFTQLLHGKKNAKRTPYTKQLLHTEAFTQRSLYTLEFLHTETFTRRSQYTEQLWHNELLHTEACMQERFLRT